MTPGCCAPRTGWYQNLLGHNDARYPCAWRGRDRPVVSCVRRSRVGRQFPFDQEFLLDAAPMRPGNACRSCSLSQTAMQRLIFGANLCPRAIEISDMTMKIEAGPLPEGLPDMLSAGQCTPERMQADQELLATLTQVTGWQRENEGIVLLGPTDAEIPPQRPLARHHGRKSAHRFDRWRDRRACRRHCPAPARL